MKPTQSTLVAWSVAALSLASLGVSAIHAASSTDTAATAPAATTSATSTTAAAATGDTDASSSTADTTPRQPMDPSKGGHVGSNGVREELLTGDTAAKATAAALAAVPGGTIQRVETDAEGATYEAHMTKSDGSQVTVKMDADFKVTGTEAGGPGGR